MSKRVILGLIAVGVIVPTTLLSLLIINTFIYPFSSATPNFADVEDTFNKLQIPSDWVVIDESENRGIAGRQSPIESDGCFNKQKVYRLTSDSDKLIVQNVVLSSGCISTTQEDKSQKGDARERYYYECMAGAIRVSGSWENNLGSITARITTWSR